jgi:16S rRNA (guanine527-N7)-methyltransferase
MFSVDDFQKTTNVSRETIEKLVTYADLLVHWQKKTNLVGPSTINDIWWRHFYDSAQLLPLVLANYHNYNENTPLKWLDFGAGAGLPGLVVSIMGGGEVHLVESNGKKCTFMRQVIRETGANAVVHQCRIENLEPFSVDIITSRALASIEQLMVFAQPFIKKNTEIWFLKGQDVDEELTKLTISMNIPIIRYKSKTDPKGVVLQIRS